MFSIVDEGVLSHKPGIGAFIPTVTPMNDGRVASEVRWKRVRLEEVYRRVIRLRMALEAARLYTFRMAP